MSSLNRFLLSPEAKMQGTLEKINKTLQEILEVLQSFHDDFGSPYDVKLTLIRNEADDPANEELLQEVLESVHPE